MGKASSEVEIKWKSSGLTQAAFCKKHKLTKATFKYWRDKHLKAEKERFVEILPARTVEPFEVKLASGALIRVPAVFDGRALRNLVEALS